MLLKAAQGREVGQGRKKTLRIPKHGKITYKEMSIMSTEAEIALHLA
jgi:ribosomal protein L27